MITAADLDEYVRLLKESGILTEEHKTEENEPEESEESEVTIEEINSRFWKALKGVGE